MKHFYCIKYQNLKIHSVREEFCPENLDNCYLYDAYCFEDRETGHLLLGSYTNKNIDPIVVNFCPFCGYKAMIDVEFDCERSKREDSSNRDAVL